MKTFIIAVTLLILTLAVTVYLSLSGIAHTEKLISASNAVKNAPSDEKTDATRELLKLWEDGKQLLSLSLYRSELERTETLIDALSELSHGEINEEYSALLKLLEKQLNHLKELESVTLDGIL